MISEVHVTTTTLPLPETLRLGAMEVTEREYAGIRIRTRDGLVGTAYCLTRDTPMAEIFNRLFKPHLVGAHTTDPAALWESLFRRTAIVGRVGLVRRVLGLIDIAVWDIVAQRAGVPLWQLLNTGDAPRETVMVSCYPDASRGVEEMAAEVIEHARQGWRLLKISRSPDQGLMRRLLQRVLPEIPRSSLIIDGGFGWVDSAEVLADLEAWGSPDLAWLEDPLLPEDIDGCAKVRDGLEAPLAVGDEVSDPRVLQSLMDDGGVDVLRLDIVAIGGITPALEVIEGATRRGRRVSGHIYPEMSVHLGIGVETFDRQRNRYDPSATLITGGPVFDAGSTVPTGTPGLGFSLTDFGFEVR